MLSLKAIDDEIAMKLAASKPTKFKPPVDQAQFQKGKDAKNGGSHGQRQWAMRPNSTDDWATWQQQPSWTSPMNETTWPYPITKGKGKTPNKSTLWCDIHQAYGHSTDWCFDNPNKSGGPPKQEWGGPPKQEWCSNHQAYGHSTEECRKGKSPSPKGSKGAKGKTKSPNRAWKSDNFPANYDQATPVLPGVQKQASWWDTEEELSSVCINVPPNDAQLAVFEDDELDEASATLLDLHFLSIVQQQERQQQLLLTPTTALQQEIATNDQYITFAYSLLDPIHQDIVSLFQSLAALAQQRHQSEQTDMNGILHNVKNGTTWS